jgi:hypothetical protein
LAATSPAVLATLLVAAGFSAYQYAAHASGIAPTAPAEAEAEEEGTADDQQAAAVAS